MRPILALILCLGATALRADEKLKALIVDGQNNHKWDITTPIMKSILETSGQFTVTVSTAPPEAKKAKPEEKAGLPERWKTWKPDFAAYDVVISNYNGELWPEDVRKAFVAYVGGGGGFVCIHAADNAFSDWPEYNQMIGVGGWGGRDERSGPRLHVVDGKLMRVTSPGKGGSHGPQHEFQVSALEPTHPIMAGLPPVWMHAKDELYNSLRGPAENLTVLASAVSEQTNLHEPMVMVINYQKGRVVHNALGHADYSMQCRGFEELFERGVEWAATGKVERTKAVPADFPSADKATYTGPVPPAK